MRSTPEKTPDEVAVERVRVAWSALTEASKGAREIGLSVSLVRADYRPNRDASLTDQSIRITRTWSL
jgi:hypothetical protein